MDIEIWLSNSMLNRVIFALAIVGIVIILFLGVRGYMERQVILTTINHIYESESNEVRLDKDEVVFISRPMGCEPNVEENVELASFRLMNHDFAQPIYLGVLEGVVPIISQADTKKLFRAGYIWKFEERRAVWVSRVGLSIFLSKATICLRSSDSPHGWGHLLFLERDGLNWNVVRYSGQASWDTVGLL